MQKVRLPDALKAVRFWRYACLAALCLSLLPLLRIAFYSHSVSDDFSFGAATRYAWVDTHSLLAVLQAAWNNVLKYYQEWQGTYSAVFLFSLQPAVFGEQYYFLSTYILIGAYVLSNFYFFRRVFGQLASDARAVADITACVVILLSMQLVPSPVNSFFWWNGSVYYTFYHCMMLIEAANLAVMLGRDKCSAKLMAASLFLSIFIAGGNFISALLMTELYAMALLYALVQKKRAARRVLLTFAVGLASFLVSCMAPGNAVRQSTLAGEPLLRTVLLCFQAAYRCINQYTTPVVMLGLMFLAPFLWRLPLERLTKKAGRVPLCALPALAFAFFASSFAPTFYSGIADGYDRIYNIRFFLWVLVCAAVTLTLVAYGKQAAVRYAQNGSEPLNLRLRRCYDRRALPYFASILLCLCLIAGFNVLLGDRNLFMSISAANSLLNGEAELFDATADERIQTLLGEGEDFVLSPYPCRPYVLYKGDFDPYNDRTVADFFRKSSVRLDYRLEDGGASEE